MDCGKCMENLHSYISGSLNELESKVISKHLKTCDKCRKRANEIMELKRLAKISSEGVVIPPPELKESIMAAIDFGKYKNVYKATFGEFTSWGKSLVAAGFIMLMINIAPADISKVSNVTDKIIKPLSTINQSVGSFSNKVLELDGISGRIERLIREENKR